MIYLQELEEELERELMDLESGKKEGEDEMKMTDEVSTTVACQHQSWAAFRKSSH